MFPAIIKTGVRQLLWSATYVVTWSAQLRQNVLLEEALATCRAVATRAVDMFDAEWRE